MLLAIKVGSVTNAQRGAKLLRQKGYRPTISRAQKPQPSDGCGYVIRVNSDRREEITALLKDNGISVTGVEVL